MRIDSQRETYFWTLLPEQTPTMECSCFKTRPMSDAFLLEMSVSSCSCAFAQGECPPASRLPGYVLEGWGFDALPPMACRRKSCPSRRQLHFLQHSLPFHAAWLGLTPTYPPSHHSLFRCTMRRRSISVLSTSLSLCGFMASGRSLS